MPQKNLENDADPENSCSIFRKFAYLDSFHDDIKRSISEDKAEGRVLRVEKWGSKAKKAWIKRSDGSVDEYIVLLGQMPEGILGT